MAAVATAEKVPRRGAREQHAPAPARLLLLQRNGTWRVNELGRKAVLTATRKSFSRERRRGVIHKIKKQPHKLHMNHTNERILIIRVNGRIIVTASPALRHRRDTSSLIYSLFLLNSYIFDNDVNEGSLMIEFNQKEPYYATASLMFYGSIQTVCHSTLAARAAELLMIIYIYIYIERDDNIYIY